MLSKSEYSKKHNLRRVVIILAFFILPSLSFSQRGIINQSFYVNNLGLYDPSMIGSTRKMNTNALFKIGDIDTDFNYYLAGFDFEYSFNRAHNIGLGIISQRESDWTNTEIFIGYAYKIDIKNTAWSIGLGLNAGVKNISHSGYITPLTPLDTSIYKHKNPNQYQFYGSAGINVWWKDQVYFSVSSSNFIPYTNYKKEENEYNQEKALNNAPGISVGLGTRNPAFGDSIIKKTSFEANLFASFFFKGVVKSKIEINFGINIRNLITPRIGFRYMDDYYILLGLQARLYRGLFISYGYDVGIDIQNSNVKGKGSHEFGLGYFIPHKQRTFGNKKSKKK